MSETKKPESALKLPVDKHGNQIAIPPARPNRRRGPSLSARIRLAQTVEEVDKLVKEGETYTGASIQSQRRWVRVAAHRKIALTSPPVAEKIEAKKAKK